MWKSTVKCDQAKKFREITSLPLGKNVDLTEKQCSDRVSESWWLFHTTHYNTPFKNYLWNQIQIHYTSTFSRNFSVKSRISLVHFHFMIFSRETNCNFNSYIWNMFLLHEPEGCNEIASRGWMGNGSISSRGRSPRDEDPLPIHPRDVISLHPKGSCSRNIVSWFTIQTKLIYNIK